MQTIWKFDVPTQDIFWLELPIGARVLSAQMQKGKPCLWVLLDPEIPKEGRRFRLSGTGHPIEKAESLSFIDTFQLDGGSLVFHLFEIF